MSASALTLTTHGERSTLEAFAEGGFGVLVPEDPLRAEDRNDVIDEIGEPGGESVRHQVEAVRRARHEPFLDGAGDLFG